MAGAAGGAGLLGQDLGDAALLVPGPLGPHLRLLAVHPGVDDVAREGHVVHGRQGGRDEARQLPVADPHRGRLLLGHRQYVRDAVVPRRDEGLGEDVLGRLRLRLGQSARPVVGGEELCPVLPELDVAGEFRPGEQLARGPQVVLPDPQYGGRAQGGRQYAAHEQGGVLEFHAGQRPADEHRLPRVLRLEGGGETLPVDGVHADRVARARGRHREVGNTLLLQRGDDQVEVGGGRVGSAEPRHDPSVELLAAHRHRAEHRVRGRCHAPPPHGAQLPHPLGGLPLDSRSHTPGRGTHRHVLSSSTWTLMNP